MAFHKHASAKNTPQTEQVLGRADQVKNNAGGYVFSIDPFQHLLRFLILGSSGGTYYQSEQKLTQENAVMLVHLIEKDGRRVVETITDVSVSGRAPKNTYALFALAACTIFGNPATKLLAYRALNQVARIPTHLFQFVEYRKTIGGGWGRAAKRAIKDWYGEKELKELVFHVLKYPQRNGWSHCDLLRLSKPKVNDAERNQVYGWMVGKNEGAFDDRIAVVDKLRLHLLSNSQAALAIKDYGLTREMLASEYLTEPVIWEALLENMPMTAMLRNLGNMSKCGLLVPMSNASKMVIDKILAADLRRQRIHPMQLLIALRVYGSGHGVRGRANRGDDSSWTPVQNVLDALEDGFYRAFDTTDPIGQRVLIGLDVSGSMQSEFSDYPGLTVCEAAAAMGMLVARKEKEYFIHGFAHTFQKLNITAKSTLKQATAEAYKHNFGNTDCSLPMRFALGKKIGVDLFVVITDNETWAGKQHPFQSLREYRRVMGNNAKLVVIGMTATKFTIADPTDAGMLDVVGFDAAIPTIISEFAKGML